MTGKRQGRCAMQNNRTDAPVLVQDAGPGVGAGARNGRGRGRGGCGAGKGRGRCRGGNRGRCGTM